MARTGRKRERITIQVAVETRTESGGVDKVWEDFQELWAERKTVRGREFYENYALHGATGVRFLCRFFPGITNQMRLIGENNQIFDIIEVNNDKHHTLGDMDLVTVQIDALVDA